MLIRAEKSFLDSLLDRPGRRKNLWRDGGPYKSRRRGKISLRKRVRSRCRIYRGDRAVENGTRLIEHLGLHPDKLQGKVLARFPRENGRARSTARSARGEMCRHKSKWPSAHRLAWLVDSIDTQGNISTKVRPISSSEPSFADSQATRKGGEHFLAHMASCAVPPFVADCTGPEGLGFV